MTGSPAEVGISAFARSDRGLVREGNEDSYFKGVTVFAVADGMGGHVAGEVASRAALGPIAELDGIHFRDATEAEAALVEAIRSANAMVVGEAESNPQYRGMGTTLTAVMVREGRLHVAHVGDSRAYLLRRHETITQLTTDHTLVEQLVQEGRLSRDEAATHPQRSVITRAIGVDRQVEVDTLPPIALQPGDQVLLCSDGLTGVVSDETIADILATTAEGEEAVEHLVNAAIDEGGPDNITVVLLRSGTSRGVAPPAVEDQDQTRRLGAIAGPSGGPRAAGGGTEATGTVASDVHRIRTREEIGGDWARSLGRLADQQGTPPRPEGTTGGRTGRVFAIVLAALVLLVVAAGGSWLVLSRAFFVGVHQNQVAVFHGLPQNVAGLRLYWLRETSDVAVDDLPLRKQAALHEGIPVGSPGEAERLIDGYRQDVRASEPSPTATSTPTPSPTPPSRSTPTPAASP